jgi:hypothetical protein
MENSHGPGDPGRHGQCDLPLRLRRDGEVRDGAGAGLRAAMRAGPTTRSAAGTAKASAAWMARLATDANYRGWCKEFALTPMAGRMVPQLPAPGSQLRVIDGDA